MYITPSETIKTYNNCALYVWTVSWVEWITPSLWKRVAIYCSHFFMVSSETIKTKKKHKLIGQRRGALYVWTVWWVEWMTCPLETEYLFIALMCLHGAFFRNYKKHKLTQPKPRRTVHVDCLPCVANDVHSFISRVYIYIYCSIAWVALKGSGSITRSAPTCWYRIKLQPPSIGVPLYLSLIP